MVRTEFFLYFTEKKQTFEIKTIINSVPPPSPRTSHISLTFWSPSLQASKLQHRRPTTITLKYYGFSYIAPRIKKNF